MKKSVIYIAALALTTLAACNNTEKEAQARLDNAKGMFERNEFFAAKSEIDSIRALYPKEYKVLKAGLSLMRQVEQKEAERNLAFCDSMIPVKEQELADSKRTSLLKKILPITNWVRMSRNNKPSNVISSAVTSVPG